MVQEQSTGLEYRFVPDGPRMTADELLPCLAAVAEHRGEFVVVSGSLPPGAPEDIYARLAEATTRRGAKFVLDSSGPGLSKTLETSHVHLMKPSRSEIEKLVGRRLDDEGLTVAAMNIVEKGLAKMVAVTLGADGALLASEKGFVRVPAIHVRVRSAVGAGDSFLGAMTWALSEGQTPEKAFRLGLAAGAAAVMMPGSKLCRKQDVLSLFERTSRETQ
jgi:6-phosphofructokinase 2